MEPTHYDWTLISAYSARRNPPQKRRLDSVILSPRPAGHVVIDRSDVSLERERSLLMLGEPLPDSVIFNAELWDQDRNFQYEGDLDLVPHAAELQRVADLLGRPIYVVQRFVVNHRRRGWLKRLSRPRVVGTFHPAVGSSPSSLAHLSKLGADERAPSGEAAVLWKRSDVRSGASCSMNFSPSARRGVAARDRPDIESFHPQMSEAVRYLSGAIMTAVTREWLCVGREPQTKRMIDRYVEHALADVVAELAHLGGW